MILLLKIFIFILVLLVIYLLVDFFKVKEINNRRLGLFISFTSLVSICYMCSILVDLNTGFDVLIQEGLAFISVVLFGITFVCYLTNKKKSIDKINVKNMIIKIVFFFVILGMWGVFYLERFREIEILNNGELVIIYNYQNGIIISDDYIRVVGHDNIKSVDFDRYDLKKYFKCGYSHLDEVNYEVEIKDGEYILSTYRDDVEESYNKEHVNKILSENIKKGHDEGLTLTYINTSGSVSADAYYILEYRDDNTYRSALYRDDKYIGDITGVSGNIDDIYFIELCV